MIVSWLRKIIVNREHCSGPLESAIAVGLGTEDPGVIDRWPPLIVRDPRGDKAPPMPGE